MASLSSQNTHLFDSGIIKINPCSQLAMKKECWVVFAIVCHYTNQLQTGILGFFIIHLMIQLETDKKIEEKS